MSLMNSGFVSDLINGTTSVTEFGVGFCLNNNQKVSKYQINLVITSISRSPYMNTSE